MVLTACSPLNQGAVTLAEDTGTLTLVLTLCEGERVDSVHLSAADLDGAVYSELDTLWQIDAAEPQRLTSVRLGEVPEGFVETIAPPDGLPDLVVFAAETSGGTAAGQTGGLTRVNELRPGVLMQGDSEVTEQDLARKAEINCSTSPFGSLGLPTWLDQVAVGWLDGWWSLR